MSEMHNILNKLQQLNESTDITEAEKKCDDCGKPISKCECEGHDHKEEMDESKSSAIAEAVSQVEAKLLKEYAEFKEMMGALHPDNRKLGHKVNALKGQAGQMKNRLKEEPNEGNAYGLAIARAKQDGKKEGDEVEGPDGKKITLTTEMFDKHDKVGTKKKTKHGTAEKTATGLKHTRDYKPDYLDLDKDGDTEEPMKKAAKDKKEKKA